MPPSRTADRIADRIVNNGSETNVAERFQLSDPKRCKIFGVGTEKDILDVLSIDFLTKNSMVSDYFTAHAETAGQFISSRTRTVLDESGQVMEFGIGRNGEIGRTEKNNLNALVSDRIRLRLSVVCKTAETVWREVKKLQGGESLS